MPEDLIILPLAYLGPVQYFSKFLLEKKVLIEQYDNYSKQTYRNRCIILGANGPVILSIPVKRKRGGKSLVKDIRIDYDTDWRRLHWRGITSAYNSSPFFEYYKDNYEPFYIRKFSYLTDLCLDMTLVTLKALKIDECSEMSEKYISPADDFLCYDYRELIHPKKSYTNDRYFDPPEYRQVFSEKISFTPNLSILDLLFNLGPESEGYLRKCIKNN